MTTTADRIATVLRPLAPGGKLAQPDVPLIDQLAALWDARQPAPARGAEPPWVTIARTKMGEQEIPGSKHNPWIATGWQRLKAGWFNDDETPWCGFFVAWCLNEAGLTYPKNFPAAASFRDYGRAVPAQVGAIGVKARQGGNHTFFIVGETPDKRFFKALGGNQRNGVNIMDIAKADVTAIRWPAGLTPPIAPAPLPVLPAGSISDNEA
jgi:uncharacterized protein (TIGR02594 family)